MSTIRTHLLHAAQTVPSGVAFRWKQGKTWKTLTHSERLAQAKTIAAMAASLGAKPGDRVALMMENRVEWTTTYLGLSCASITVVPIDAKLLPQEVAHILRDSGAVAIFAGGRRWPVLSEIEDSLPALRHIILLDQAFKDAENERHHDFDTLFAQCKGSTEFFDQNAPTPETVASILYTSGTTGRPKGAMLTHGNFHAQIVGCLESFHVYHEDNFFLVLPLHHAFAFTASFLVPMAACCEVSMAENLRTIAVNMREVHPTILLAVPLLAEKMLEAILHKLQKNLFASLSLRFGLHALIGKSIIRNLGGRLRILICGGAASDIETLRLYNRFGLHTIEGYGLTETAPICALTPETEIHLGTVGKAFPHCGLSIDSPNEEGVGEICVSGPILMKGYFHNDEATAQILHDGKLFTGDLGRLDSNGYLTITGRKKALIVNREGKNIYPEEVELAIASAPHILESVVVGFHEGDETGERVGVILVPNMDRFTAEARGRSLPSNPDIEALCTQELHAALAGIAEYKRPRKVQFRYEPFERTTTQKIKRFLYSIDA